MLNEGDVYRLSPQSRCWKVADRMRSSPWVTLCCKHCNGLSPNLMCHPGRLSRQVGGHWHLWPMPACRARNAVCRRVKAGHQPMSLASRPNTSARKRMSATRHRYPPARRPTSLARKTQQPHPQVNVGGAPVIPCHAQAVVTRARVRPTAPTARNRSRTARGGLRASRIQRRLRPIRRRMPQQRRCPTRNRLRASEEGLRATGIGRRTARNALRAQQKAPRVELFTRRAGLRASRLGWAGWRARWHAPPSGHCTVLTVPAGVAVVPAVLAAPSRAPAGRREKRADMPWRRLSRPEPSPTTRSRA